MGQNDKDRYQLLLITFSRSFVSMEYTHSLQTRFWVLGNSAIKSNSNYVDENIIHLIYFTKPIGLIEVFTCITMQTEYFIILLNIKSFW